MLDIITNAINRFYKQKDYHSFKKLCKNKMECFEKLKDYIESKGFSLTISNDYDNYPSITWYISLTGYEKGEFKVSYSTQFQISKVVPAFYIQHEFEVENKDEKRMSPDLDGYSVMPYSIGQFELEEQIVSILTEKGYQALGYGDIHEVVEGFKMPEGVTIFGPQITVELLLFKDVLNICDKG